MVRINLRKINRFGQNAILPKTVYGQIDGTAGIAQKWIGVL
jgi:hypothetical protein